MKAYQIVSADGIDGLKEVELDVPKPGPNDVLVRVHASSINYRDLSTIENPEVRKLPYPRVPNSDGAGEVIEIGRDVTRFKPGDRVCGVFFQSWIEGSISESDFGHALGGTSDGMLAEFRVLPEDGLVATPHHLTDVEAATLPCAPLTAWNSMVEAGGVTAGHTVLLLGTGGVSVAALQFCQILGARTIITSSSEDKLAHAQELGANDTINYIDEPDWELAVLDLTDGVGVDHVVEVGGAGTMAKSIAATRVSGSVGVIGILTGGVLDPTAVLRRSIKLQGIYVGSRRMFEEMNRAIELHDWRPVIDTVYPFAEARQAYHAMRAAGHFGKLVISID